ncbi:MAG TPA: M28 family peptidase [Candidatus Limnocylindria bacterium]|nr:M28 family peptidase [Candidatus Limnocylindria bacterium]
MRRALNWQLIVGLALILGWLVVGFGAPFLTGVNPLMQRTFVQLGTRSIPAPFEPGTFGYPLGSDRQGRDLWVTVMFGAQATFTLAFVVLAARLVIGVALGAVAGWFAGRWIDRLVSALVDAFAAFPTLLFAVLWIFAFDIRSGLQAFAAALTITGWHVFGRATRSALVDLKGRPFLEAARAEGLSEFATFARHAVPNLLPMLAITAALEASAILLVLGELGFLGYVVGGGTSIPLDDLRGSGSAFFFAAPEWGAILAQGRFEVFRAPWIALVPAAAFASGVLAFNLAGHGLRIFFERAPVALGKLLGWRTLAAFAAVVLVVRLAAPFVGPAAGLTSLSRQFDGARARADLAYIADPARGGRYTGSKGYQEAAAYVADRFRALGLEPAGDDGSYYQRFTMSDVGLTAMPSLQRLGADPKTYRPRIDFSESVGGRRGGGAAEGAVIYVGGGNKTAAYSDYAGVHPEGNIVMIAGPSIAPQDRVDIARREGAVGVIVVSFTDLIKPSYIAAFEAETIPVLTVSAGVANELIAASGKTVEDLNQSLVDRIRRAQNRPSLRAEPVQPISFDTTTRIRFSVPLGPVHQITGQNVIGILRGSDPARADKFVLVGGHLDGIGTDPDGTVFPAANDNGSGPAVTLEVARVLAANRATLKNSVIFAVFAGEEEGLVGSEYFVNHSLTTPLRPQNVLAFVNLDVSGCCGDTLAASDESFAMHARLASAADRLGYAFGYVPAVGGSDHLSYTRRGVPAALLGWTDFGGFHTTRDTLDTVTAQHLTMAGQVATQTVLELAASN